MYWEKTEIMALETKGNKRVKVLQQQHHIHGSVKTKPERNEAFYHQAGFIVHYPKSLVYPLEGGEVQLEQLRARLDKYCPPPQTTDYSCDDMEMTMACTTNITILPGLNKENVSSVVTSHPKLPLSTRQPLQLVSSTAQHVLSADEDLARLCQEKQDLAASVGQTKEDSSDSISELLDDMMLQQSAERQMEKQSKMPKPVELQNGKGGMHKLQRMCKGDGGEGESGLREQENQSQHNIKPHQASTSVLSRGIVTRLNFSDAESSLGTSHLNSLMEDSLGGRASMLGHSQVCAQEHSGVGGQSFEIFHDSWRNQSGQGRPTAPDNQLPTTKRQFGNPLKRKSQQEAGQVSYSLAESYHSQPGVSKSSFSLYEDSVAEQSSFVPFHDSWNNTSKDAAVHRNTLGNVQSTSNSATAIGPMVRPTLKLREVGNDVVYQAALGVPLEGDEAGVGNGDASVVDQTFTQIGICHPKIAPSISTPVGKCMQDFTFNMSRIQTETELMQSNIPTATGPPQHRRSCFSEAVNLSTIKEESSSLKSSRSNASSTASSSSSSSSSSGHDSLTSVAEIEINPFSSEIVNKMLNAMSPSVMDSVCTMNKALPQLITGHAVLLEDHEYSSLKFVSSGGFSTVFTCKDREQIKVLKVQKPPMQWEIAIISELHTRLKSSSLFTECYVKAEQSFIFNDASVMVQPCYSHVSLMDLANTLGANLCDPSVFYYTAEVLDVVASLHYCGILHANIKPENFMLIDLSSHKSFKSTFGHGLVLIDFDHAIDLTAFSGDTLFHGSTNNEGFQCPQMLEGKPWKYEADYFGIAATAHVLLTGEYMTVVKDEETNLYQPQKPLQRTRQSVLWKNLLSCLMNTSHPLPLTDMAADMRATLNGDRMFQFFLMSTTFFKKKTQRK